MRYLSVCSGMEAASVAWEPLGWSPVAFSEIEPFPSAILKHRFPNIPNYGDLTKFQQWPIGPGSIDLLVGGTPCQAFSSLGKQKGFGDARTALALSFVGLVEQSRPRWFVWENVERCLSSNQGRDFGLFVGSLARLGYCCAWRLLDARNFGLKQRRKRLFLVGNLGTNPYRAASVFFKEVGCDGYFESPSKKEKGNPGNINEGNKAGRVVIAFQPGNLRRKFGANPSSYSFPTLSCDSGDQNAHFAREGEIRRITPKEAERLQGFPDDWSNIPWNGNPTSPDNLRYRACGNSMAVPVMRWIGEQIARVERESE